MNPVNYCLDNYSASILHNKLSIFPITEGGMPICYSLACYSVDISNPGVTITPNLDIGYQPFEEMYSHDFSHSEVLDCKLNGVDVKLKYRNIMIESWALIGMNIVKANTKFKIVPENVSERGYKWNKKLQLSFRNECATRTMHEILHICKVGEVKLDISIRLKNGDIVRYNGK